MAVDPQTEPEPEPEPEPGPEPDPTRSRATGQSGGARRLHAGGRLSFRRRLRGPPPADVAGLPYIALGDDPPRLERLVPAGCTAVEIEVGPGKGTFLLAAAMARPETFVLGIEAAPSYAVHVAARIASAGLRNAVCLVDNAKLYLRDRVGDGALERLHVYFSDPWPKRRHKKRRFFTPDVAALLHRVLKPGGWCLCSTDNAAYAAQICLLLGACPGLQRDEAEEARLAGLPPGSGFSPTSFESKYREEGRRLRRYAFRRV